MIFFDVNVVTLDATTSNGSTKMYKCNLKHFVEVRISLLLCLNFKNKDFGILETLLLYSF